ncbi:hypothetical protein FP828_03545 [bacterium]|nr:hypothetical protein [Candidatus Omnitrophota bacterium]MBA3065547.1 hypothetical protein [bacterium]
MAIDKRKKPVKSARELENRFIAYFEECTTNKKHALISGLALAAGVSSTTIRSWRDKNTNKYHEIITWAYAFVENGYEKHMSEDPGRAGGDIFALKNMGWKDKKEFEGNFTFADMVKAATKKKE